MAAPTLGQTIRNTRLRQALGLRELAKRAHVAPSYLSDIETDRRVPAPPVLHTIARHLDLSYDTLMALAGRLDQQTQQYLKTQPQAAILLQTIATRKLNEWELKALTNSVQSMSARPRD